MTQITNPNAVQALGRLANFSLHEGDRTPAPALDDYCARVAGYLPMGTATAEPYATPQLPDIGPRGAQGRATSDQREAESIGASLTR